MEILQKTFRRLELDSFNLVGLSMGGALSIEYASLHPRQVKSLVLFEPGGLGDKINLQFIAWLYTKIPFMLQLLSKRYAKMDQAALKRLLESLYVGAPNPQTRTGWCPSCKMKSKGSENMVSGIWTTGSSILSALFVCDGTCWIGFRSSYAPTLWLRGAESVLVKQWEMERAVKLAIRNGVKATLKVIPRAGRPATPGKALEANAAVKRFLSQVGDGS
ncbi:MAG: alpha/beta hydrolase [Candidatus Syntrophopropionicum ammoniitolerans]